jgi:hypothetical protein
MIYFLKVKHMKLPLGFDSIPSYLKLMENEISMFLKLRMPSLFFLSVVK